MELVWLATAAIAMKIQVLPAGAAEDMPNSLFKEGDFWQEPSGLIPHIEDAFGLANSFGDAYGMADIFKPFQNLMGDRSSSLKLSIPLENSATCQVRLQLGENLEANQVKLSFHVGTRQLVASYHKEAQNKKEGKNASSSSFRSVQSTSSIVLPSWCIATTTVFLLHLAGFIQTQDPSGDKGGLIVFPSLKQLSEMVEKGLLPANIIDAINSGSTNSLDLTQEQLCLAAGFTDEQCKKFGNRKPNIEGTYVVEDPYVLQIPHYEAMICVDC